MILQYIVSSNKEKWRNETSDQFETPQSVSSEITLQKDTITKVLNLVKQGDWAISLDLKDAYFHVQIFKKHKEFLRFCVNNQVYKFKALCFGPTSSPRVFTKVVSVVASHLRKQNIRLAIYLDDWLGVNQVKQK